MSNRLGSAALVLLFAVACGGVKQKQPPRIPDDGTGESDGASDGGSSDMDLGEEENVEVAKDAPEETPEQKKAKCCQQCVDGLADDKSGDPPGALPCTKLTSKMQPSCVVWFDKNPMNAQEAQAILDELKEPTEEETDGEVPAE